MTAEDSYDLRDPRALKALAHPLRGKLLASLRMDGPATASMLGRRYDESSGMTSYHLRTLARYGFVEDDPERRNGGRERWWRAVHATTTWSPETFRDGEPGAEEAMRAFLERVGWDYVRYYQRWVTELGSWSPAWQDAALTTDRFLRLTPRQLAALHAEFAQLIARYAELEPDGEDAERVAVIVQAFPQRGPMP
ncbi:MAG TPA: helix-turn-helix domain-containing protein [Thermoleophilaceae bacterium]